MFRSLFLRYFALLAGFGLLSAAMVAQSQGGPVAKADDQYRKGLDLWRGADLGNNSCSFCHSPEGFEIAAYNFDDATILRRAEPHFGKADAPKLLAFIKAVRSRYGFTKLLDPMKDRPLQPGGELLPGDTPEQRDLVFGLSLKKYLPALTEGNVDSLQSAKKARDEVRAVNPRTLPVGIVFNRISEDAFHGREHATFAHWIADEAVLMKFPWGVYNQMVDTYINDPSMKNLQPLVELLRINNPKLYGQLMASDKFRMLVLLQHITRMKAKGIDFFADKGPVALAEWNLKYLPNPFLELAMLADDRQNTPFDQFLFPSSVVEKKTGVSREEQLKQLRLPNLWAGWLFDEGLLRSGFVDPNRVTRIMTERLFSDGPYPFHDAFFITKKIVTDGFEPRAWNGNAPQHFAVDYSWFLSDGNVHKFEPKDAKARELYRRFVANSFKMSLYLYREQLQQTHTKYAGDPSLDQIAKIEAYVKEVQPRQSKEVNALAEEISSLAAAAANYAAK